MRRRASRSSAPSTGSSACSPTAASAAAPTSTPSPSSAIRSTPRRASPSSSRSSAGSGSARCWSAWASRTRTASPPSSRSSTRARLRAPWCAAIPRSRARRAPRRRFFWTQPALLQELLYLLDPGVHALFVHAGRARQADTADSVVADLDRHPAVDRDHVRQRGLLAPHRAGLHLLHEGLGGHPEGARG